MIILYVNTCIYTYVYIYINTYIYILYYIYIQYIYIEKRHFYSQTHLSRESLREPLKGWQNSKRQAFLSKHKPKAYLLVIKHSNGTKHISVPSRSSWFDVVPVKRVAFRGLYHHQNNIWYMRIRMFPLTSPYTYNYCHYKLHL